VSVGAVHSVSRRNDTLFCTDGHTLVHTTRFTDVSEKLPQQHGESRPAEREMTAAGTALQYPVQHTLYKMLVGQSGQAGSDCSKG
jgi:hypothetical protein